MYKLIITLIILAWVASGCGKESLKVPPTVCTIDGVDIYEASCCQAPFEMCKEKHIPGREGQV